MAKDHLGSESQRAEQIDKIRDLTVLGVNRQISSRSELGELAIVERILVRKDGRPNDYTSIYRYLDALHFLGLDISEKYDYKQGTIEWSSDAIELARLGTNYYRSQFLSLPEKTVLRKVIFLSKAKDKFLSTFCPGDVIFDSQKEFLDLAFPLYITELSVRRPREKAGDSEEWPAEICVRVTPDSGIKGILKPKKEFLYTYRYWCLDTGIIDELNIREAKRYEIPQAQSYVLYPINSTTIKPADFLELLFSVLERKLTRPQAFAIPWLMYRICPQAKLSIEDFKTVLVNVCQENRNILHLERGSGGLLKGVDFVHNIEFGERYGNHRYYPVINGTIRTNLIIFPLSR